MSSRVRRPDARSSRVLRRSGCRALPARATSPSPGVLTSRRERARSSYSPRRWNRRHHGDASKRGFVDSLNGRRALPARQPTDRGGPTLRRSGRALQSLNFPSHGSGRTVSRVASVGSGCRWCECSRVGGRTDPRLRPGHRHRYLMAGSRGRRVRGEETRRRNRTCTGRPVRSRTRPTCARSCP